VGEVDPDEEEWIENPKRQGTPDRSGAGREPGPGWSLWLCVDRGLLRWGLHGRGG
jgi:hypothetical protein